MSTTASFFAPRIGATGEPVKLAMQRLWLGGRVAPVGARLTVQHVFRSEEKQPIEVIYAFPLPRDAALRAFRITGAGSEVDSELRPVEEAVRRYEEGIAQGSLAAMARNYGDGLVNLTVGNVRPGETVTVYLDIMAGAEPRDDGFRFRFPFTLAPSYHSLMRAATVDGEGELELPSGQFGDVILPRWRADASGLHEVGFDLSLLNPAPVDEIGSPSHSIRVKDGGARVMLAPARDVPDRDLVLDVKFKETRPQVIAGPVGDGKRAFAAIVPSTSFGERKTAPRRIAFLLDRSGSMDGEPIQQARQAILACLALLTPEDRFTVVAFDDAVELMEDGLAAGDRGNRDKAAKFLRKVDARGGTELARGFLAAARMLEGGGDMFVFTDGQVFGTEDILAKARSAGVRISCLGIGAASQDRFLTLLGRETGGISRFVTPRERVDLAAVDLFASVGSPVASGLKAGQDVQPAPVQQVFPGTPVLVFGVTGCDSVDIEWDGGRTSLPIPVGDAETGATVRLLQGARLITDWESRYPAEAATGVLEARKRNRVAARLVELSSTYGLASREMALVAVVKRAGDRPGELPETRVVPVGVPQDMAFDSVFGAPGAPVQAALAAPLGRRRTPPSTVGRPLMTAIVPSAAKAPDGGLPAPPEPIDGLMDLAAQLEPDGGMPGRNESVRAKSTAEALLTLVEAGHTLTTGAFRIHVGRMVAFLKALTGLRAKDQELVDRAIRAAAGLQP